jgi:hypothetical protein
MVPGTDMPGFRTTLFDASDKLIGWGYLFEARQTTIFIANNLLRIVARRLLIECRGP